MTDDQPKTHVDPWSLLGVDPNMTGGMCSVDYVRWQRDYQPDELEHEACADIARRWEADR
jgi:hypothetical protein